MGSQFLEFEKLQLFKVPERSVKNLYFVFLGRIAFDFSLPNCKLESDVDVISRKIIAIKLFYTLTLTLVQAPDEPHHPRRETLDCNQTNRENTGIKLLG